MDYSIRNYMRVVWHGGSWVIVIHMVMVDGDIAVGLVWCGVYGGGLEIKAKDLSSVFCNEFTKNNKENGRTKFYKEEIGSLEAPIKKVLFAEPSMLDLEAHGASFDGLKKNTEIKEDEKKAQEGGNKGELTEDEHKNEMDLGY